MNAKKIASLVLLVCLNSGYFAQSRTNKSALVSDISIGNGGVYGIGSIKAGGEFRCFTTQKWGVRIGAGLDITPKIGAGIYLSPYEWGDLDLLISCDLTRMFGGSSVYKNDHQATYTEDKYEFDNTNILVTMVTGRYFLEPFLGLHVGAGWGFGITNANIRHISGPELSLNRRNISNRLIGGYRLEFGLTFRGFLGKNRGVFEEY